MISRRKFSKNCAAALGSLVAAPVLGSMPTRPAHAGTMSDDGLHIQDWFLDSFLELQDDLSSASDAGKHFAVIFEQRGCPYCAKTHEVNFSHPKVLDYIPKNFDVLQLNLHGSREVVDFDGEVLEERRLARKWLVNFTPTIVFFPKDRELTKGKSGRHAEIARLPGYFKPFSFISMFRYVRNEVYIDNTFQNFLSAEISAYKAASGPTSKW